MTLTGQERQTLIELYDQQPHPTDKLGGTIDLTIMTGELQKLMTRHITEGEVLTSLIALRKSGSLNPKDIRMKHDKPKGTFKLKDFKNGCYEVVLTVKVGTGSMQWIIASMIQEGRKPVTRQEVYDYMIENPSSMASPGVINDRVLEILYRLFPEFK